MYRYNSFLKDEGSTSLIRVHNKEYRIKKEIFTYEELLKCMSYFKELREVETLEEYTLQSKIVRFLMQIGVLNYSEVTYPDAKMRQVRLLTQLQLHLKAKITKILRQKK